MDIENRKKKIISDTVNYTFAQYGSNVLDFVYGIAVSRFLGPYLIGVWNMLKVLISYCNFNTLGSSVAVAYSIPFYRGKKDQVSVANTQNSFFTFSLLVSIITSLILLFSVFILHKKYPSEVIIGIYVIAIYTILQKLYNTYIIFIRAYKEFSKLSRLIWIDSILNLIFVFLLVKNFKIYGLYGSVILTILLDILYLNYITKYKIKLSIDWQKIIELIKFGLPIFASGLIGTILQTVDRIMIAKMLGITFVGYYSLGISSRGYVYALSNNLGTIVMPHMMESYGSTNDKESMRKYIVKITEITAYLLPFGLGVIYYLAPLLITLILPKFIPGIIVLQILLMDIFFRSCNPQFYHFLVALGKQINLVFITSVAVLIDIVLNYYFIKIGYGISGVAVATSIASFFVFLVYLIYSLRCLSENTKGIVKFFLRLTLPLYYMLLLIFFLHYFRLGVNIYAEVLIKTCILFIAYLPVLYYINKKTRLWVSLTAILKQKLKKENDKI